MKNSERPAFPVDTTYAELDGLTKREYFAGLAMQGILANMAQNENIKVNDYGINGDIIAMNAIECADKLLKQLETK